MTVMPWERGLEVTKGKLQAEGEEGRQQAGGWFLSDRWGRYDGKEPWILARPQPRSPPDRSHPKPFANLEAATLARFPGLHPSRSGRHLRSRRPAGLPRGVPSQSPRTRGPSGPGPAGRPRSRGEPGGGARTRASTSAPVAPRRDGTFRSSAGPGAGGGTLRSRAHRRRLNPGRWEPRSGNRGRQAPPFAVRSPRASGLARPARGGQSARRAPLGGRGWGRSRGRVPPGRRAACRVCGEDGAGRRGAVSRGRRAQPDQRPAAALSTGRTGPGAEGTRLRRPESEAPAGGEEAGAERGAAPRGGGVRARAQARLDGLRPGASGAARLAGREGGAPAGSRRSPPGNPRIPRNRSRIPRNRSRIRIGARISVPGNLRAERVPPCAAQPLARTQTADASTRAHTLTEHPPSSFEDSAPFGLRIPTFPVPGRSASAWVTGQALGPLPSGAECLWLRLAELTCLLSAVAPPGPRAAPA
ncbi:collagen alpha-1(I) chain-like [Phyllostomus hastatus]|uniref:collagen alpha-1(I) chain-like n=1 Tax=Phyllostomus hastatus TaxID=9423 RepID=UPI001E67E5DF|nr:collagen alpha-1(I) chain-like [Phyllostomus hastatus]